MISNLLRYNRTQKNRLAVSLILMSLIFCVENYCDLFALYSTAVHTPAQCDLDDVCMYERIVAFFPSNSVYERILYEFKFFGAIIFTSQALDNITQRKMDIIQTMTF